MTSASGTDGQWWLRLVLAPLLLALVVISVQALRKPQRAPQLDEFYYLTIARDLNLYGVFTNGTFKRGPFNRDPGPEFYGAESVEWAKPGRFFAPVYPLLAHVLSRLDGRLAASIRCHVAGFGLKAPPPCANAFGSLVAVNIALWSVAMLAVFLIALRLGQSETVAWLAMLIALATGEASYYARTYLSENTTVPAFLLFMLAAMHAVECGSTRFYALAGAALGVAALSRPAYAYLFYALVPMLFVAVVVGRRRWPSLTALPTAAATAAFTAATLAVLAPWMLRNQLQFGDPSLSRGYAEVILMQRVSYNRMSVAEWLVAWIYWLPDFGDEIARQLFPARLYELLGWSHPQNYYLDSDGAFRDRVLAEAGSDAAVLGHLMRRYLLGDLVWHTIVSLPLTMRGLGVAKYLSVAGVALLWPVGRWLAARGRLAIFLAALLPPLMMAGLHGFVSVNIERYNLPMIAIYATVLAIALTEGWRRWQASRLTAP